MTLAETGPNATAGGPGAPAGAPQERPRVGGPLRNPGVASWIARERLNPGPPSRPWVAGAVLLGLVVTVVVAAVGLYPTGRVAAEEAFLEGDAFLPALQAFASAPVARAWSAIAGGALVAATTFAARRLLHADGPALLAGLLVALDPMVLAHGRLATQVAPATALAVGGLALFLAVTPTLHWIGSAAYALACFLDPHNLLWMVPLAAMMLVRGHIYAAPRHLLVAGAQTVLVPAAAAVLGMVGADSLSRGCTQVGRLDGFLLAVVPHAGGNVHAVPNPALWLAGIAALAFLGGTALADVLRGFRLQRLPGRLQIRLPRPLRREQGRALWLLALAAFAPTPVLWVPVLAMAIAAGVQELSRDARGFGGVVGAFVVGFAVAYTIRLLPVVTGDAGPEQAADLARVVPWTRIESC